MKLYKTIFAVLTVSIGSTLFATEPNEGSSIAVSPISLNNADNTDNFIPLMVQSQLETDFQNYSWFSVINRSSVEALSNEQQIAEIHSALVNEDTKINYAVTAAADFTIIAKIIKTGNTYTLNANIISVKENTSVGKAFSLSDISLASFRDASVVHLAAYELLKGTGHAEKKIAGLKGDVKNDKIKRGEVEANYNVAKGIIAESSKGNIIEAMAYYQKAVGSSTKITEGAERLSKITASLTMKNKVKNEIAQRKQWVKMWDDLHNYIQNNCLYIAYNPNSLRLGAISFKTETANLDLPIGIKLNPICYELYEKVKAAYEEIEKTSDWGINTGMYLKSFSPHTITVEIFDEANALIARQTLESYTSSRYYFSNILDGEIITLKNVNPERITDKVKINIKTSCPGAVIKAIQTKTNRG